jgi:hypothetical protein
MARARNCAAMARAAKATMITRRIKSKERPIRGRVNTEGSFRKRMLSAEDRAAVPFVKGSWTHVL